MKLHFTVEPIKFENMQELPKAWNDQHYRALLDIMEYGDTSDLSPQELKEMCLLSLSDNDPEDAAKLLLEYLFKDRLNAGQIENLSHEMMDEKMWEEYAVISMHEEFFNITQLLYQAYNGKFPHPEAVRFKVSITPKEKHGNSIFEQDTEASLIRILVNGMPENTLINRLFSKQIETGEFADAKDIIWQYKKEVAEANALVFEIISSEYWFRDFKYAEVYDTELMLDDPGT